MPAQLEEITAVYLRQNHRWDDTVLADCRLANGDGDGKATGFDLKVDDPQNELVARLTYRFYGRWYNHPKYGRQFHAKTFVRTQPHGQAGVIRYLSQAPGLARPRPKNCGRNSAAT